MAERETIIAEATPPGYGGISIVRISGKAVPVMMRKILGKTLKPRYAEFRAFCAGNEILDEGIALYFQAPNSFTGEDVLELQCHGGYAAVRRVMDYLLQFPELRMAMPGEFTRRAFLNGKIDLTQAEAVAELIHAGSEEAAKSALLSLTGNFAQQINALKTLLTDLRTYLEGHIDFAEEEELAQSVHADRIKVDLEKIAQKLHDLIERAENGRKLHDGITVTLIGKTNAGKSSLFNALKGEDRAIVTNIPGTTRDVLRETINLHGVTINLSDTAGFNQTTVNPVELEGIRRTNAEVTRSMCLMLVHDLTSGESFDRELLSNLPQNSEKVVICNKIDRLNVPAKQIKTDDGIDVIYLSAKTGEGIDLLLDYLSKFTARHNVAGVFSTGQFALNCLYKVRSQIEMIQKNLEHLAPELIAEDVKEAQNELGKITGEVTSEEILDQIFANFCVGK